MKVIFIYCNIYLFIELCLDYNSWTSIWYSTIASCKQGASLDILTIDSHIIIIITIVRRGQNLCEVQFNRDAPVSRQNISLLVHIYLYTKEKRIHDTFNDRYNPTMISVGLLLS